MKKRKIIILLLLILVIGAIGAGVTFLPKPNIPGATDDGIPDLATRTAAKPVPTLETAVDSTPVADSASDSGAASTTPNGAKSTGDTDDKRRRFRSVDELSGNEPVSTDAIADPYTVLGQEATQPGTVTEATGTVPSDVSSASSELFTASEANLTDQNASSATIMVHSVARSVENGLIIPIYEVDVPAEEAGVLRVLSVEDFEQIQKDQLLVQIDDRQAVMTVNVAEAKKESAEITMKNDVNVRYAIAAYNVADAEIKQADEANSKVRNTVTIAEYNRLVLSRTQAKLQIEQAQQELKVAAQTYNVQMAELDAAKLDQSKFEIHSPHDGVVMELYRKEGEWLKPGDPILRLVQMNPIRYSFRIESKTPPESIFNQPVSIFVSTLGREFRGMITYIKPSHDIGDMYQVWVDIENQWQPFTKQDDSGKQKGYWLLQPGMRAEVRQIGPQ